MCKKLLCLCFLLAMVGVVSAIPVAIPLTNPSFEADDASGGTLHMVPTGWEQLYQGGGSNGIRVSTLGAYPNTGPAPDGVQEYYGYGFGIGMLQKTETITSNTTYEASFDIFYTILNTDVLSRIVLNAYDPGTGTRTELAAVNPWIDLGWTVPQARSWNQVSVSWDSTGSTYIGQTLEVELHIRENASGDMVTLTKDGQLMEDNSDNLGLYRNDVVTSGGDAVFGLTSVPDDNASGRTARNLVLADPSINLWDTPVLSPDGGGVIGESGDKSLLFSGGAAAVIPGGYSTSILGAIPSIEVEFDFKINPYDPTGVTGSDFYATLFEIFNTVMLKATTSGVPGGTVTISQGFGENVYLLENAVHYNTDPNAWNHLIATWDGDSMTLSINGESASMDTGPLETTWNHVFFGARSTSWGQWQFSGAIDEIRYSQIPSSKGDLDYDGLVDPNDLAIMAGHWLGSSMLIDDFESYADQAALDTEWILHAASSGTPSRTLIINPADAYNGDRAMVFGYHNEPTSSASKWSEIIKILTASVDISDYNKFNLWIKADPGSDEPYLLYIKLLNGGITNLDIAADARIPIGSSDSPYAVPGQWYNWTINANSLLFSNGYTDISELTDIQGFMIGCVSVVDDGAVQEGSLSVDEIFIDVVSDINGDGNVNFKDFAILGNDWLAN